MDAEMTSNRPCARIVTFSVDDDPDVDPLSRAAYFTSNTPIIPACARSMSAKKLFALLYDFFQVAINTSG